MLYFIKTLDWPFFSEIHELRPAYYFVVQFGGLQIILKVLQMTNRTGSHC